MGVKDLWQLLSPIGRRVSIETLEGKTLAIDASIWITQFIKAMRDEEGKMMKNAHLIGTLRRVLKLLFHRIRPLFVFDGATPLLKLRTVQARRKGHEKQEESKKIAAQRLLRAQLKQYALKAAKPSAAVSKEGETTSGNYVSTFKQPAKSSNSSASRSAEGGGEIAVEESKVDDDVEWVDGYEGLSAKNLETTSGGQGGGGGGEEAEMEWQLPEDSDDLSPEALAALPAHIRKSLIEEARRRQRMESRAHYLPVAGNPALYSQTQLSNFLSSSKLNRKFADAHQSTQNVLVGTSIAAEGRKKYQFISRFSLLGGEGSNGALSAHSDAGDTAAATMESDDEAGSYWEPAGFSMSDAPEEVERSVREESEEDAGLNASEVAFEDGGADEDEVNLALAISASLSDFEVATGSALPRGSHRLEEVKGDAAVDEVVGEENEDVAWESGGESESAVGSDDGESWDESEAGAASESRIAVLDQSPGPKLTERWSDSSALSDVEERSAREVEHPLPTTVGSKAKRDTDNDFNMSSEALTRAVTTASSMADWAGRAVRSALKEHARTIAQQTQQTQQTQQSPTSTKSPAPVGIPSPIITEKIIRASASESAEPRTNSVPDTALSVAEEDTTALESPAAAMHDEGVMDMTAAMTAEEVYAETRDARRKFNAAMRDTETLTDEMRAEVIELLQALNLPYLVAPYEAEAQCAVLEQLGLVDGVVTEDSDALLFGANTVYKNIFNDKKYVEVYLAEDARREMGLQREDLVALAYFLGSDYCEGVTGVGIVNAVEIIHAFPMQLQQGSSSHSGDIAQVGAGPLRGLRQFKDWLHGFDLDQELRVGSKAGMKDGLSDEKLIAFTEKHKHGRSRWTVPASFPDPLVARAYLSPQADNSPEKFAWTVPDARSVRSFCSDRLGWTEAQMDMAIDPVLRRYAERSHQPRIDAHFLTYHGDTRFAKIASDRLREAVVQITGKRTNLALGGSAPSATSSKRPKSKAKKTTES